VFTRGRPSPLWAIATDAIANRLHWAGQAVDRVGGATALATELTAGIGPHLPTPRSVDIRATEAVRGTGDTASRRFVRRVSCCLLYRVPGEARYTSCPRRTAADRHIRLTAATPSSDVLCGLSARPRLEHFVGMSRRHHCGQ
jgi:hypothetical protein